MPTNEEYYIKDHEYRRKNRYSVTYTVAKFNYHRYPEAIYEVKEGRFGWECTCPAHVKHGVSCKHIQMVIDWVKAGKPSPFDFLLDENASKKPVVAVKKTRRKVS